MADIRRSVRDLFLQGVKAVNGAAAQLATATQTKVDEMNLRNRRRDLFQKLSGDVYSLWQEGVELPEALTETLEALRGIDNQLAELAKSEAPAEAPAEEAETSEAPVMDVEEEASVDDAAEEKEEAAIPSIDVEAKEEPAVPAEEESAAPQDASSFPKFDWKPEVFEVPDWKVESFQPTANRDNENTL